MHREQALRIAKTESFFRNVNERIAESAERFGSSDAEFMCECHDQTCTDRVAATLEDYEQVREEPTHFLLAPGHENAEIERVVRRGGRFRVVEKFHATVAAMVRRYDPRAEPA